jgi:hypothetical protein
MDFNKAQFSMGQSRLFVEDQGMKFIDAFLISVALGLVLFLIYIITEGGL